MGVQVGLEDSDDEDPWDASCGRSGGEKGRDRVTGTNGHPDAGDIDRAVKETGRRPGRWTRRGHGRYQSNAQSEHSSPKEEKLPEEAKAEEEAWTTVIPKGRYKSKTKNPLGEMTEVHNKEGLRFLQAIKPEGLNTVRSGEWEEITMYLDSGATETVIHKDMPMRILSREGLASRQGITYEVANGVRTANLGEKAFVVVTEDGPEEQFNAQVCGVNKALLSVCQRP